MTHRPERTCLGCRATEDRSALMRIARTPGGEVILDLRGRAPGRGAYVHRSAECIEAATRKGAIAGALRAVISPDELGRLRNAMSQGAL